MFPVLECAPVSRAARRGKSGGRGRQGLPSSEHRRQHLPGGVAIIPEIINVFQYDELRHTACLRRRASVLPPLTFRGGLAREINMLAALGVVSSIFDVVTSLSSSSSASSKATTGFTPATTSFSASPPTANSPSRSGDGANGGKLSPDTLNDLFGLLDADGDGAISKSEFETALGAGGTNTAAADGVFARMDKDGDGGVNADELASALAGSRRGHGHHHHAGNAASGAATSSYSLTERAATAPTTASVSVSA
ncbi:MAG: EF-hand domain-containing protein [Xanthobacteraceae bacterium]|nr:EF-hand domain-containing protein [Xanthobacteraceae bacterium]